MTDLKTEIDASRLGSVRVAQSSYYFAAEVIGVPVVVRPSRTATTTTVPVGQEALMIEGYRELADESRAIAEESLWATAEVLPTESG